MKNKPAFFLFVQIGISILMLVLLVGVIRERYSVYAEIVAFGNRIPYADQIFIAASGLIILAVLVQTWLPQRLLVLYRLRHRLGWLRWVIALLPALLVSWLFVFSEYSLRFDGFYTRVLFYLTAALFLVWMAARSAERPLEWRTSLAGLVVFGCIFVIVNALQDVVDYPFLLSWSEGNRFYDYSVLFGRRLYDFPSDQPLKAFIDIGRQSLWGLPFLFGNISIRFMRFWNQFLFTIPYLLLGWVAVRKQQVGRWVPLFFGLWALLFLNQGPIYTPLVLAAVLVALTRRSPLWLALPVVMIASYYARLARFTWLFAPAMWAVLLAFLDRKEPGVPTKQRWLRSAALGFAGLLGGYFLPELFPALTLHTGIAVTATSVDITSISQMVERQPLIWSRLWPNETYSLGIVLGLLLAAGPLIALLSYAIASRRWKLDGWQISYLAGMSLAFLVVGVVISVKIGGGSNLHNLDMFLIGLVFTAGLWLEQGGAHWLLDSSALKNWGKLLIVFLVVYPATLQMFSVSIRSFPDQEQIQKALTFTQKWVDRYQLQGEILFLDQRQLLTFGYVDTVPLVTDYEKKLLMEEAMQNQADYFADFYRDLAAHRFSLIITEPLYTDTQEDTYQFGSENNAWVRWVSIPTLCYYDRVRTFPDVALQFLLPKEKSSPAPGLTCPEW